MFSRLLRTNPGRHRNRPLTSLIVLKKIRFASGV